MVQVPPLTLVWPFVTTVPEVSTPPLSSSVPTLVRTPPVVSQLPPLILTMLVAPLWMVTVSLFTDAEPLISSVALKGSVSSCPSISSPRVTVPPLILTTPVVPAGLEKAMYRAPADTSPPLISNVPFPATGTRFVTSGKL